MSFSSKDLLDTVERTYGRRKAQLRENYAYARSLGFSGRESGILSQKTKLVIDTIHAERLSKAVDAKVALLAWLEALQNYYDNHCATCTKRTEQCKKYCEPAHEAAMKASNELALRR